MVEAIINLATSAINHKIGQARFNQFLGMPDLQRYIGIEQKEKFSPKILIFYVLKVAKVKSIVIMVGLKTI